MRVLMLSDATNPHTVRWVRALDARGLDVLLFSLQQPDPADYSALTRTRVETQGLPRDVIRGGHTSSRKLRYFAAVPRIRRLARQFRPDVSNAHFATSYGLLGTLAGLEPLVVSVWGTDIYDAPRHGPVVRSALKWTLRRAGTVLSTSHVMAEATRRLVPRNVPVTPFGVDTDRFCPVPRTAKQSEAVRIGILKALEPKYGIDVLLRAVALLRQQMPVLKAELVIAGDGSQRARLERLAADLGIAGITRFLGWVGFDEVHHVHQSLDIGVYPSVDPSETFGVSAVECQACGVPVVASAIGGLSEVVADGVTGLLVKAGDLEQLAGAIGTLATNPSLRLPMGAQAREHVLEHYSLEHSVDLMIEQYRLATAKSRGGGPVA